MVIHRPLLSSSVRPRYARAFLCAEECYSSDECISMESLSFYCSALF